MANIVDEKKIWKKLMVLYYPEYQNYSDDEFEELYQNILEESGVVDEPGYDEAEYLEADNQELMANIIDNGVSVDEILKCILVLCQDLVQIKMRGSAS